MQAASTREMNHSVRAKTPLPVRICRAVSVASHLLAGFFEVLLLFPFYGKSRRNRAVSRWSARLLAVLNVRPSMRGSPPLAAGRAAVLVANHVSWLDIHLIHSVWQVRFIAKSEVRRWPLIGWLSAHAGTLFIERGKNRHAARINQSIKAAFAHAGRRHRCFSGRVDHRRNGNDSLPCIVAAARRR
jgi:1-acyl-sn-glycerol-3-phosphate acyltransferase